jgi:iron(III) transport system ATP-binding protein
MSAVELCGVDVAYDAGPVVRGVDLAIETGEMHVLLGESGSGKTTILRAIAGFEAIAAGTVRIGDTVVDGGGRTVPPERRAVGVVFQDYALFAHLDVAGNVGFAVPGRAPAIVGELLDRVGLAGYERRPVADLSGGEQQRVALARALAQRPRVILLDEPFSNLNPELRHRLRETTVAILREAGVTGLLVTHDRVEAFDVADRISVIRDGRLLQTGTPRELYQQPGSVAVAAAVGEVLQLPCTVDGDRADCVLGPVRLHAAADGASILIVRPEQLRLDPAGDAGVVRRVRYFGAVDEVEVEVGAHLLRGQAAPGTLAPGDRVGVTLDGPCVACAG